MTTQQTTPHDTTTWALEREKAYELFGGTSPYATDDEAISAVFTQHPAQVIAEIARIADAYAQGKVHTPWRALASRLEKIKRDAQPVSLTQDLRIRQAENWIRNAGLYCPSEAEVTDELFNSHGLLAGQATVHEARMLALWRHEQPRALLAEQEAQQRAAQWKQGQESLSLTRATPPRLTIPEDAGPPDEEDE